MIDPQHPQQLTNMSRVHTFPDPNKYSVAGFINQVVYIVNIHKSTCTTQVHACPNLNPSLSLAFLTLGITAHRYSPPRLFAFASTKCVILPSVFAFRTPSRCFAATLAGRFASRLSAESDGGPRSEVTQAETADGYDRILNETLMASSIEREERP